MAAQNKSLGMFVIKGWKLPDGLNWITVPLYKLFELSPAIYKLFRLSSAK
jgi:hypothetical protein